VIQIDRRHFVTGTLGAFVGGWLTESLARRVSAAEPALALETRGLTDRVTLGATGLTTSRMALGGGTNGWNHHSDQGNLGVAGFAGLLQQGFERGLTFFETADQYGTHAHVGEALRAVGRDKCVVLTKTNSHTATQVSADLDRFRRELGVETIDVVLLHAMSSARWATDLAGPMDALSDAKRRGAIRAHGVSCHDFGALETAAASPWTDVVQARINMAGTIMDGAVPAIVDILRRAHAKGKAVIGMKILGQGQLAGQVPKAIAFALGLDCLSAFTIGFTSLAQLDQILAAGRASRGGR
jgi:aryl-alcohol dehydrogenase-like predicted oxidoreductase